MNLHDWSVGSFAPALRSFSAILDKAAAHGAATGQNPDAWVEARLAPDMFTLGQQVWQACFYAVDATARLAGGAPPEVSPEGLATLGDLKALIARSIALLEAIPAADFAGAEARAINMPLVRDLELNATGVQLLRDWALPHFYFHVVTAYDILRQAGAPIGKFDYLAHVGYAIGRKPGS